MADFPTLSRNPSYPFNEEYEDNTIRSPFEAGYEQTRPRYTRMRKTFTLKYEFLMNSDKTTLENFYYQMKGGAGSFNWTHPITNDTYIVRFAEPLKFENPLLNYWNVEIKLRQV